MNEPINHRRLPHYYSHPEVDKRLEALNFDTNTRISIQYVLKVLVLKHHMRKKMKQDNRAMPISYYDPHCWLSSVFYQYLLSSHQYKSRMDSLVKAGILKAKLKISTKGKHTVYRLAKKQWYSGYSLKPVVSNRIIKKVASYSRYRRKTYEADEQVVVPHIISNFTTIDLTEDQFREIWRRRYMTRYLLEHTEYRLTVDQYMERGEVIWQMIDQWNHMGDAEKPAQFKTCNFGHRLHYPFTYMPKEIRPYILDKNGKPQQLTEFDMRCCQPTIFANLLVGMNPEYKRDKFVKLVESGLIYQYVQTELHLPQSKAKQETLHMLFCHPGYKTQIQFETLFPAAAREAKRLKEMPTDEYGNQIYKSRRYVLLPQAMQRSETQMFRPLRTYLIDQGYTMMPIHDAIYVANITDTEEEEIRKSIEQQMTNCLQIQFKVKSNKCFRIL